jgi:ABC-2 type transport system permease protein
MRRLRPLFRKELRQLFRSRGALLSATFLPLLLLVITPGIQYFALTTLATPNGAQARPAPPGVNISDDPKQIFAVLLLPLFVAFAGLITPSVTATYTVVGERERRSLDLLAALPVRAADILTAKLLAILTFAAAVLLPMFALDAAFLLFVGAVSVAYLALLLMMLAAALSYAVGEALLLALLARDLRTAQNLNGALLVPVIAVASVILFTVPPNAHVVVLSGVFLAGAAVAIGVGYRWLSFERYLL